MVSASSQSSEKDELLVCDEPPWGGRGEALVRLLTGLVVEAPALPSGLEVLVGWSLTGPVPGAVEEEVDPLVCPPTGVEPSGAVGEDVGLPVVPSTGVDPPGPPPGLPLRDIV